jgi:uncharacterized membrane protein
MLLARLHQPAARDGECGVDHRERPHAIALGGRGPGGKTVEWDAIVTEDDPARASRGSRPRARTSATAAAVEFRDAPGGRGTVVTATIAYDPPGGAIGKLVAKLFQKEPLIQARRDLRRLQQYLETGEISTSSPPNPAPAA